MHDANEHQNLLVGNGERQGQNVDVPVDEPVPQAAWYYGVLSTLWSHCSYACFLCRGPCCAIFHGKVEAAICCLCTPFVVLYQAVNEQRSYFKQAGIVYVSLR